MAKKNLLFEIGLEDLPAKNLNIFSEKIKKNIKNNFLKNEISFYSIDNFYTNQRLVFFIKDIEENIVKQKKEIKGPPYDNCFDENGLPNKVGLGFAKKYNTEIDLLYKKKVDNRNYLFYEQPKRISNIKEILPSILEDSLDSVEDQKKMRWGDSEVYFIRPIRWMLLVLDDEIIFSEILGIKSENITYGNKCLTNNAIKVKNISEYFSKIKKNGVEINQDIRKKIIKTDLENIIKNNKFDNDVDYTLIDELANMVEYPYIYLGKFPEKYLDLPNKVLKYVIQDTQKYFIVQKNKKIINYFVGISNIEINQSVVKGNERVINPRLDDAKFFISKDLRDNIFGKKDFLKRVVFHKKLGSMFDKVQRISEISSYINTQSYRDNKLKFKEIANLCKLDLISNMVVEIPKLQGYIGSFYAKKSNFDEVVANGIREHYSPKNPEDGIPESVDAQIVSMADKIDTIVGIFLVNEKPSGTRDPLAIRRSTNGFLRVLLKTDHSISLTKLIDATYKVVSCKFTNLRNNKDALIDCHIFLKDKLITMLEEDYRFRSDLISSVINNEKDINPFKALKKIKALNSIVENNDYEQLFLNAKRVSNILKKSKIESQVSINENLLRESSEKILYNSFKENEANLKSLFENESYKEYLKKINELNSYVIKFFDEVMINDNEEEIKLNRISLLTLINKSYTSLANLAVISR